MISFNNIKLKRFGGEKISVFHLMYEIVGPGEFKADCRLTVSDCAFYMKGCHYVCPSSAIVGDVGGK